MWCGHRLASWFTLAQAAGGGGSCGFTCSSWEPSECVRSGRGHRWRCSLRECARIGEQTVAPFALVVLRVAVCVLDRCGDRFRETLESSESTGRRKQTHRVRDTSSASLLHFDFHFIKKYYVAQLTEDVQSGGTSLFKKEFQEFVCLFRKVGYKNNLIDLKLMRGTN